MKDLFENITLFSNRMLKATYKKVGNEYEVTLTTTSEKVKSDAMGKESKLPLSDYIDIGIFAKPKNDQNLGKPLVYKRIKLTKKENVFTFKTKANFLIKRNKIKAKEKINNIF